LIKRGDRRPPPPGAVFRERVLEPLRMTQREAAERLKISYPRMNEIINGKRAVTPETALRLARFSGTDPGFWLDLQQAVDLWDAMHAEGVGAIQAIEPTGVRLGPPASDARVPVSGSRTERYGEARVYRLGEEPDEDLLVRTTAAERLAMVEELSTQAWALAEAPHRSEPEIAGDEP